VNDYITVGRIIEGKLPDDFDADEVLDDFIKFYNNGDPKHPVYLEEPEFKLFEGEPMLTIDSGYSYLPGAWFLEYVADTYKITIECEAYSITDNELLDRFVVGADNATT
jgi:hypothetical protein